MRFRARWKSFPNYPADKDKTNVKDTSEDILPLSCLQASRQPVSNPAVSMLCGGERHMTSTSVRTLNRHHRHVCGPEPLA